MAVVSKVNQMKDIDELIMMKEPVQMFLYPLNKKWINEISSCMMYEM